MEAREERESGDDVDRSRHPQEIGDDAREEGPDGVAQVAPEAIGPHGRCPPLRMGHVADSGEEYRVNHGGAEALESGPHDPPPVLRHEDGQRDPIGRTYRF